jgi:Zn-finger nucleic acid-binding protein
MKCPEDRSALQVGTTEGHAGYVCAACAGTWLPARYVASLAHDRNFDPDVFFSVLSEHAEADSNLVCPHDGALLARALIRDIELDWCRTCRGVWFNAGELQRLLAHHPQEDSAPCSGPAIAGEAALHVVLGMFS